MADDRSIRVRFVAEVGSYIDGVRKAGLATKDFGTNLSGHGKAVKADIEKVGRAALLMSGGMVLALGASAKAAIDWESAWAGVTKTVDSATTDMGALEEGLRDLARELPSSHKEIAAVAEAAGQLGIAGDSIVSFTRTMIDLGQTTNLSADEAATGIAQIRNVMGFAVGEVDNFGAALVDLGNNGASTEADILNMAKRLAGAGSVIGASAQDVLALSNTMASLGIQSELGGGAMSRTLYKIEVAVQNAGDGLDGFAKVAGMSAADFAQAWETDPIRAFDAFNQGLGRIADSGGNVIATLADLKIKGTQDLQVLTRMMGAGSMLGSDLDRSAKAWKENTALAIEASKRYATTESQIKVLRNNVVDLAIDLGDSLLPALKGVTEWVLTLTQGFSAMPGPMKTALVAATGLTAGILGIVGVVGTLGPKVAQLKDALNTMGTGGEFLARNLKSIGTYGAIAVVGIAAVAYAMGENARKAAEAEKRVKGWTDAIREAGDAAAGTEDQLTKLTTENADLAELLSRTGTTIHDLSGALSGGEKDWEGFQLGLLNAADAAGYSNEELGHLSGLLGAMRGEVGTAATDAELLGNVLDDTAEQTGGLTAEQRKLEEATKAVTEALDGQLDAQNALINPYFALLDALHGNTDARQALVDAMADESTSLDDLDRLQQDAARSALDVEQAAARLALGIQDGSANLEIAQEMLRGWVREGLISQETAQRMGELFGFAADQAHRLGDPIVISITADTESAEAALKRIGDRLAGFGITGNAGAYYLPKGQQGPKLPLPAGPVVPRATGGGMLPGTVYLAGETGQPELIQVGAPSMAHNPNATATALRQAPSSSGSTVIQHIAVTSPSLDPAALARTVRDAAEMGARRGIKR